MALCENQNLTELFRSVMHKPFTPQNFGSSLVQIEADIQRRLPGGVDAAVYCKSAVPGWSQVPNNKGIIAVLIGIQSPRDAASGQASGKRVHKAVYEADRSVQHRRGGLARLDPGITVPG